MVVKSAARDIASRLVETLNILVIDLSDATCQSPIKMFHVTCCIRIDESLPWGCVMSCRVWLVAKSPNDAGEDVMPPHTKDRANLLL
jgi:hypothetical protein